MTDIFQLTQPSAREMRHYAILQAAATLMAADRIVSAYGEETDWTKDEFVDDAIRLLKLIESR